MHRYLVKHGTHILSECIDLHGASDLIYLYLKAKNIQTSYHRFVKTEYGYVCDFGSEIDFIQLIAKEKV